MAIAALVALAAAACGSSATAEPTAGADTRLAEVDHVIGHLMEDHDLDGAALVVLHGDERIERTFGEYDVNAPVRLASASKWIAAATIMALVDDGLVELDAPISEYLAVDNGAGDATMRQLLTHSAGIAAAHDCVDNARLELTECATSVLSDGLVGEPGSVAYGSPSFQVAGAVAESVTGADWPELFDEYLAEPVGLQRTTWRSFDGAITDNPDLGAGLVSSPADYAQFLAMLLGNGTIERDGTTVEVLSAEAVDELHTVTARVGDRGFAPGNQQFDLLDGGRVISSPGVLGTRPWLVPEHDLAAVLVMEAFNAEVVAEIPGAGAIHFAVHNLYDIPFAPAGIDASFAPYAEFPRVAAG